MRMCLFPILHLKQTTSLVDLIILIHNQKGTLQKEKILVVFLYKKIKTNKFFAALSRSFNK